LSNVNNSIFGLRSDNLCWDAKWTIQKSRILF